MAPISWDITMKSSADSAPGHSDIRKWFSTVGLKFEQFQSLHPVVFFQLPHPHTVETCFQDARTEIAQSFSMTCPRFSGREILDVTDPRVCGKNIDWSMGTSDVSPFHHMCFTISSLRGGLVTCVHAYVYIFLKIYIYIDILFYLACLCMYIYIIHIYVDICIYVCVYTYACLHIFLPVGVVAALNRCGDFGVQ